MEDSREEYLFLGDKLGMLFNIHDSKVTVVGLDSSMYRQAPTTLNSTSTNEKVVNKEEDYIKLYKDAISLVPSVSRQNSVGAPSVDKNAQRDNPSNNNHSDEFIRDEDKMSAAEVISALANLDAEDQQSAATEAIVVEEPVGENEQIIMNPIEGSTKLISSLPAEVDDICTEETDPPVVHAFQNIGTVNAMVASDSYEDFQEALNSSFIGSSSTSDKHVPLDGEKHPEELITGSATFPAESPVDTQDSDSPFGHLTGPASTADSSTPITLLEDSQHIPAANLYTHKTNTTAWLPPTTPPPPPPVAAVSNTLVPRISQIHNAHEDDQGLETNNHNSSTDHNSDDQLSLRRSRVLLSRLFGIPIHLFAMYQKERHNSIQCNNVKWLVRSAIADLFITKSVENVNTVQIRDLDSAFQLALMKQKNRPLMLTFRTHESASTSTNSGVGETTDKFKYSLFMAKYTSNAAAHIRHIVDTTLQDYVQCDWAEIKAKQQGLPQTTIISIYRYIESEMIKLELFNYYHAKGYDVPVIMLESHWNDIRNHIEALVYRAIGPYTRTLWPIFSVDSGVDFMDTEDTVSDLKANTLIGVDLHVHNQQLENSRESRNTDQNTCNDKNDSGSNNTLNMTTEPESTSQDPSTVPSEPIIELSTEHPLRMKLAFLRFVTLESTGLDCGGDPKPRSESIEIAPEDTTNSSSSVSLDAVEVNKIISKMRRMNSRMLRCREEWYLAMRGLCRALQLETPGEVLQALTSTIKLISHALDGYLYNNDDMHSNDENAVTKDCTSSCFECHRSLPCSCGEIHLVTEHGQEFSLTLSTVLDTTTSVCGQGGRESPSATLPHTPVCSDTLSQVVTEVLAGRRVLQGPVVVQDPSGNTKKKRSKKRRILSADDLMPAITYVLIQANPPNIEYVLWMCTEFRHPELLRGEEAFCLAQLSSAVEFCKRADYRAFDIPHRVYNTCMLSYTATLQLLLACKQGDTEEVRQLVETQNADINGLSPDHKDNPLTACIRFGHHAVLRYLLTLPGIDTNAPIQLFHGLHQRSTPLILATQYNQLEIVIDLLVAGADRQYTDDSGITAFSVAVEHRLPLLQMMLNADPYNCDLIDKIIEHDNLCAIGLLLQKVDVNYFQYPEQFISPLTAAVIHKNIQVIRFLLNRNLCIIDIDMMNKYGQTALMICTIEFIKQPCVEYVYIAAMLLRFGADRYIKDNKEKSALDYIKEAREMLKAVTLQALNPFEGAEEQQQPQVTEVVHASTASLPPPPLPEDTTRQSAAVITAPSKRRHSTVSPASSSTNSSSVPSPLLVPPSAPTAQPSPLPTTTATAAPPTTSIDPTTTTYSVNTTHRQLLKEFYLLLYNDPLNPSLPPIYELSRDRRLQDVKSLLYQGVDVNTICIEKGYTALIAAVYNRDIDMVRLLLQSDEICKNTYFSTRYSVLSAINSVLKGTPELIEADAEVTINAEGIYEGEKDGYLRTVDNTEREFLTAPHSPVPKYRNSSSSSSSEHKHPIPIKFAGKSNTLDLDCAGRSGMRALHYASQIGDIHIVGALLHAGATREVFNNKLHTPLDVCLTNGHVEVANALRFDPEKVSICLAARHGDWTVLSALLAQEVSINTERIHMNKTTNTIQYELYTPLLAAVAYGQEGIAKHILETPGINVNLANPLNQTALMFAAARGDENIVLRLLNHGADRWVLDKQGYIATAWAESRRHDSIAIILKHDPKRIWIHDVIRNDDFNAVVAMLKQKVDVNLQRFTKLVPESPAMVSATKLQLSSKVSTTHSTRNCTPLPNELPPSESMKSSVTSILSTADAAALSHHTDIHSSSTHTSIAETDSHTVGFIHGETPLIVAAHYGRLDVIALLLKAPPPSSVQMNLADSVGNTPLHHAAYRGQEEAVIVLLKAHAARHTRNLLGLTPLAVAKSKGHSNIAALIEADPYTVHIHDVCEQGEIRLVIALLKQGCPVNFRDERAGKRLQTPLIAASHGGQADVVRMLLRYSEVQENIDLQDSLGRTALMRAAAVGALNVTAVLLNAGCDRTLKDNNGFTARDHASKHSYTVMFQFISQSMVR